MAEDPSNKDDLAKPERTAELTENVTINITEKDKKGEEKKTEVLNEALVDEMFKDNKKLSEKQLIEKSLEFLELTNLNDSIKKRLKLKIHHEEEASVDFDNLFPLDEVIFIKSVISISTC